MKKIKSPMTAALISALAFPGVGQIYAKCYIKGVIYIVLTVILFINIAGPLMMGVTSYISQTANLEAMNPSVTYASILPETGKIKLFSILITLVWLFSIIDAWACAKRMNALLADSLERTADRTSKDSI